MAAVWVGSGFVQKMVLAYRLNAEVAQLQRDNARVADENKAYRQQLGSLQQTSGQEELERQHNYARPDEKVFVITGISPSPTLHTAPSPRASNAAAKSGDQSFWGDFWAALTSIFH